MGMGGGDLVVVRDHPFDPSDPCHPTVAGEVVACERDGRRDVIECLVGPNPEVVKHRGNRELLKLDTALHNDGTQIQNAIRMVPIRDEVVPRSDA